MLLQSTTENINEGGLFLVTTATDFWNHTFILFSPWQEAAIPETSLYGDKVLKEALLTNHTATIHRLTASLSEITSIKPDR